MAKEDFKDGAQPIDMDDYPYKGGEKLPNGITVLSVIRGDESDTFGGYLVKPVEEVRGTRKLYGKPFVLKVDPFTDRDGRNPLMDPMNIPDEAESLEMLGPVGDPWAQRVTFRLPEERGSHNATPQEFLNIAKSGKLIDIKPESEGQAGDTNGWTEEEDEFIRENYTRMTDKAMAEALDVDVISLKAHRLEDLGLKKSSGGGKG